MFNSWPWTSGGGGGRIPRSVSDVESSFDNWLKDLSINSFKDGAKHDKCFRLSQIPLNRRNVRASFVLTGDLEDIVEEDLRDTGFDLHQVLGNFLDGEFGFVDAGKPWFTAIREPSHICNSPRRKVRGLIFKLHIRNQRRIDHLVNRLRLAALFQLDLLNVW